MCWGLLHIWAETGPLNLAKKGLGNKKVYFLFVSFYSGSWAKEHGGSRQTEEFFSFLGVSDLTMFLFFCFVSGVVITIDHLGLLSCLFIPSIHLLRMCFLLSLEVPMLLFVLFHLVIHACTFWHFEYHPYHISRCKCFFP